MIRPAFHADVPKILEMGQRFFDESGYRDVTIFRPEVFAATVNHLLTDGVLLLADQDGPVGMAAAIVFPFYFSGELTAQEMFWYVDKEHRGIGGQLLDGLIGAVKARGATSLSMIGLENLNREKVAAMYQKRGFRAAEHMYIKRI